MFMQFLIERGRRITQQYGYVYLYFQGLNYFEFEYPDYLMGPDGSFKFRRIVSASSKALFAFSNSPAL